MEFDQNQPARPFSVTLLDIFRGAVRMVKHWKARRDTRRILSRLSDNQLQDIGITRGDISRK